MKVRQHLTKIILILTLCIPILINYPDYASASVFTKSEIKQVKKYQREYKQINKTHYTKNNFLKNNQKLTNPSLLKNDYLNSFLETANYYRSFYQLPNLKLNSEDMYNAQITAQIMAAVNAPSTQNEHGMPYLSKTDYISRKYWSIAKKTSLYSNLDFTNKHESGNDIVKDFFGDVKDLNGNDTGHRAWLISPYVKVTGFGSYYSPNMKLRYSIMPVLKPVKKHLHKNITELYPVKGLFPIEECKTKWSVYLLNKRIKGKPKITITDLDTQKTTKGTKVKNYSKLGYGYFKTVIAYNPGKTKLVPGHQYRIKIVGITTYTVKLFNEKTEKVYME